MLTETTRIALTDLRIYAYHGLFAQERRIGAWFTLSVRVDYPFEMALDSDRVDDTLSYDMLAGVVRREMAIASNLLEHVAGRILSAIFREFPSARWAEVEISKENPPIGANLRAATITLSARNEKK